MAQTTDGTTQVASVTFDISTGGPGGVALNNCSIFINGTATGYDLESRKPTALAVG
jgi:Tfp pilus assembly protein PilW